MEKAASECLVVDSVQMKIGNIADADLDRLHALSMAVGWPHRAEDWQFLRHVGKGVVALDDIGRILGSVMWFPHADNFATIGMMITSPRLQANGTGRWLMRHALTELKGCNLGLSATRAAHRLYLSLGFEAEKPVYQCQGEVIEPDMQLAMPDGAGLREVHPDDVSLLGELDRKAFGAYRLPVLAESLAHSKGFGLFRNGKLKAFALCRPFGRGHVIGPVVANHDQDAIAVTRPFVAEHAGRFLRLDTRQKEGSFAEFLSRCGMPVFDTVTTMSLGQRWIPEDSAVLEDRSRIYALASQTLG
ncbi:GNAT family N-acetyltransferase [Pararhizobium sp. LjRoot238]|uniref:GNAT family N-acetyltransferase n=1 Tax=Pararhizobium sp. LjRoot238 TaxID=3342293 RepID=UPI003F505441